jgi:hypothetical protein
MEQIGRRRSVGAAFSILRLDARSPGSGGQGVMESWTIRSIAAR